MPAKHKTLSVYPDPTALALVGGNSPSCNLAIECWAKMLQASHPAGLDRADWNLLADVLNGTMSDASWTGQYLLLEINDAFALNGADWKWYGSEAEELRASLAKIRGKRGAVHPRGAKLIEAIGKLDYAGVQAILVAVRWFWHHHEEIDTRSDLWWVLQFRVARYKQGAGI